MSIKPFHYVLNVDYDNLAFEICTKAVISDPVSKKNLNLNRVIWDTGATNSTINTLVAQKLGLIPNGKIDIYTSNGPRVSNTYVIDFKLPNGVGFNSLAIKDGDLGPETEMLVGMDVIALGDFAVQNHAGKTQFSFCVHPFENKYDMSEKANTVNAKIQKQNSKLALK